MCPPLAGGGDEKALHGTLWETESTRPAATSVVMSEEPPAETNGSGESGGGKDRGRDA